MPPHELNTDLQEPLSDKENDLDEIRKSFMHILWQLFHYLYNLFNVKRPFTYFLYTNGSNLFIEKQQK